MKLRGFLLIIVLVVMVAVSAAVVAMNISVGSQEIAGNRAGDEAQARAIAEQCLESASGYAISLINQPGSFDFDFVLNPVPGPSTDDYLPPSVMAGIAATATVHVPNNTVANDPLHQFRYYPVRGGACLVRFDDDSDDANPTLPATAGAPNPAGSPAGADDPLNDRDRIILATAIGIFPVRVAAGQEETAYRLAHTRITLRRVIATQPTAGGAFAIEAGTSVTMDGSICGLGGVQADSVSGGACVCGPLDTGSLVGSQGPPCPGCLACAATGGTTPGPVGPRPNPDVRLPVNLGLMDNNGFGFSNRPPSPVPTGSPAFATPATNLGTKPPCKIFARADDAPSPAGYIAAGGTDTYVWDFTSTNPNAYLSASGWTVTAAGGNTNGSCAAYTTDPVEKPCKWDRAGSTVTCSAGETLCWKLVARSIDTAPDLADLDPRRAGAQPSHDGGSAANFFAPKSSTLPNMEDVAGVAPTWGNVCGGCTTCTAAGTPAITRGGTSYTLAAGTTTNNFPSPAVVAMDTPAAGTITIAYGSGALNPQVSLLAQARVAINTDRLCCAECACPAFGAVACAIGALGPPLVGTGIAVKTTGACDLNSAGPVVGEVRCANINADTGPNPACVAGALVATEPATGSLACAIPGSPCPGNASICFKNNAVIFGDVIARGNVNMKNNGVLTGSMQSESNVCWKNNGAFTGVIAAEQAVLAKNNSLVTFPGFGAGGTANGANAEWSMTEW